MSAQKKRGRPRKLTAALAGRFLHLYGNSTRTVRDIAAQLGLSDRTVEREAIRSPCFLERYQLAREAHALCWFKSAKPGG